MEGLKAAYITLVNKKGSIDAVENGLEQFENNPLFNAGVGSKIDETYHITMDASIMNGRNLSCGAVAGVKNIKNPIKGARLVMEQTKHVLIIGDDADKLAEVSGLEMKPNDYFFTENSIKQWIEQKENPVSNLKGTTGVVALDQDGNLAAGTSTGGLTNKKAGRVGDSPIIGAGNYANNKSLAVSCTGTGEIFMKNVIGFDLHARVTYKNISLNQAAKEIMDNLEHDAGGFISVDKDGNVEMPYNSSGMARGYVRENGIAYIYIFPEGEDLTPIEYDLKSDN